MNKLVRAAQTSQSLSLAAMEEASRLGLREADIDHLFLALVINDQSAGRALRELGIDIDNARLAVEEQRDAQLTSLGIEASFPEAGRIVFHETDGYEWTPRARDLIAKSSSKGKPGDAAAVLRELVAEPSGLITEILRRLGTTPDALIERLDRADAPSMKSMPAAAKVKGGPPERLRLSYPHHWTKCGRSSQTPHVSPSGNRASAASTRPVKKRRRVRSGRALHPQRIQTASP